MDVVIRFPSNGGQYFFLLRATRRRDRYRIEVFPPLEGDQWDGGRTDIPIRVFHGHSLHTTMGRATEYIANLYGFVRLVDAEDDLTDR